MSKLLVERQDAVTVLTLNRPEVHNNVDDETAMLLADAIDAFAADDDAKVLVITGAGDRTFCAGANLKGMAELFQHRRTYDAGPMGFARLDPDKPVIGAINGACYAGGVELAVWCDFRIVDERAKFGLLNKRWGLSLADGGTQRLPRVVGIGNALYMIETGVEIDAARAQVMGLAQEVVPAGTALDRALELAHHCAGYSQVGIRADRKAAIATLGLSAPGRSRPRGRAVPRPGAGPRGRRGHAALRRGQQARAAAAGVGLMRLYAADELPYHQVPTPFHMVGTSDAHFNDGYFIALYAQDWYFFAGLRLHPNGNVIDGWASVAHNNRQVVVRASRALRPRYDELAVGPVRLDDRRADAARAPHASRTTRRASSWTSSSPRRARRSSRTATST